MPDRLPLGPLRKIPEPIAIGVTHLRALPPRRRNLLAYLAVMGPGLIAATAGNDAGGIATYSAAGASYGYSLLWMLAIITISLVIVQEMCARMGAATGKGLSDLIREHLGIRLAALVMLSIVIANLSTTVSEFVGIAASLELFGVSRYLAVPVAAALIWWLVVKGSYRAVERVFLAMSLVFLGYIASAFLAHPNWSEALGQTLIPSFHLDTGYVTMFIATVGTTITPYMQIYVQSSVVEKGVTMADFRYEKLDVLLGSIFSNLVAFFIIVSTAATLFAAHVRIETAADAARALEPLAGPYAEGLFAIGLLGASMLAAGVVPLATAYSITEALGFEKGVSHSFRDAPVFMGIFTGLIALGAVISLIPGFPLIPFLVMTQVVAGVLLPILLFTILRLVNDRAVMGEHVNGPIYNVFAWTTVVGIALLSILYLAINVANPH